MNILAFWEQPCVPSNTNSKFPDEDLNQLSSSAAVHFKLCQEMLEWAQPPIATHNTHPDPKRTQSVPKPRPQTTLEVQELALQPILGVAGVWDWSCSQSKLLRRSFYFAKRFGLARMWMWIRVRFWLWIRQNLDLSVSCGRIRNCHQLSIPVCVLSSSPWRPSALLA